MVKSPILWIVKHVRRRIPAIIMLVFAQVLHALLSVFFALGFRQVVDAAASADAPAFFHACLYQASVIVGIVISVSLSRHLRDKLHADLDWDFKRKLLHGLLHGDYTSVSAYHSGELINRLTNDVNKINDGILTVLPNAASMITRLVAALIVLGMMDIWFAILITVFGVALIVLTAFMRKLLKNLNKRVSEHDGKVSGFLQEIMGKLLMVQSMDVSHEVESRADVFLSERYKVQRKRKNISLFANTSVNVIAYISAFFALVWCSNKMLLGQMTFGELSAVTQLVTQLQAPISGLSGILPQYVAMIASAERLMELEEIQGEPAPIGEAPQSLYERMDCICAKNLTFSYGRDQVLTEAEFSLPKGAFAVVTGASGIGKSTLLKLLLGIFRPENGGLFLEGREGAVTLDRSTRRLFAYVPQGNLLLSGTLRDNLTIVKPQATQEELDQAIHVSAMDDFLPQLPLGLDTPLGESGAGLSEGQAQRLAIARAVLGGAPILLLDECTSALDAQTEQKVLQYLKDLPNRTCIAVTHRPAAIEMCNWRLEIRDKKITAKLH